MEYIEKILHFFLIFQFDRVQIFKVCPYDILIREILWNVENIFCAFDLGFLSFLYSYYY